MIESQLDITSTFNRQGIPDRKAEINKLQRRSQEVHQAWIAVFGYDTLVPIDRAYDNLVNAMQNIQYEDWSKSYIDTASEQLDQAEWVIENEQ